MHVHVIHNVVPGKTLFQHAHQLLQHVTCYIMNKRPMNINEGLHTQMNTHVHLCIPLQKEMALS